ncbi:MAG: hypothetical protein FWD71_07225 [Oscillospiraceae bacterium]|nr:hypothetical protein [Oscillospiraceae bacterium]
MILNEFIDGVRYPDEIDGLYFDATPYDEINKSLEKMLLFAKGQLKKDVQETLAELERRWVERQANKTVDILDACLSAKTAILICTHNPIIKSVSIIDWLQGATKIREYNGKEFAIDFINPTPDKDIAHIVINSSDIGVMNYPATVMVI